MVLWLAVEIAVAQSTPTDSEVPIWKHEILEDLVSNRPAGVVFLDDQQLIVYVLEPSGQLSSRRSHEISSAYRLRVRIVDVQSGKTRLTKDLNALPLGSTVQVTTDGILVNTGDILKLYSTDFATAQNLTLPVDEGERLFTTVSPTGRTIMTNRFNPKWNVSRLDVFDASTLTLKQSWSQSPRLFDDYSISDKGIATGRNSFIVFTDFGSSSWRTVGKKLAGNCLGGSLPILYSDQQLMYASCNELLAASTDGQVVLTDLFPRGDRISFKKAVARGGRFVAVSSDTVEVKKHFLMEPSSRVTATHVAVYDLSLKKRVLTVAVDPVRLPKNDYDFALSPDGSKLAILNHRNVLLYAVTIQ